MHLSAGLLQGSTYICSELLGVVWSCSEQLCRYQLLPLQGPTHICSELLAGCPELFGVSRSNSVVASCSTHKDLPIFARSCSELVGIVRSCSEKERLSNQSHSKCTNGTVYKVKTSKLENIVKPAQCVEKILCTRLRILKLLRQHKSNLHNQFTKQQIMTRLASPQGKRYAFFHASCKINLVPDNTIYYFINIIYISLFS